MAIFHLSMTIIGRSKGRSSIAAAAYRSGEILCDIMGEHVFDFTRKTKVDHVMIMGGWTESREYLWNTAEIYEKRKNSRTAREFNIALPIELNHHAKVTLVRDFVKSLQKKWNFIADIAFHNLSGSNPHVHIMVTTRVYAGGMSFGKKIRDLDKKSTLVLIRKIWADAVNAYLAHYIIDQKVDHRSYEAQGILRLPGCHLGPFAHRIEQEGKISKRRKWHEEWMEILALSKKKRDLEEAKTSRNDTLTSEVELVNNTLDIAPIDISPEQITETLLYESISDEEDDRQPGRRL